MPPQIVVVGSINMDLVARVPRLPAPGETVGGRDLQYLAGGKGANQAVAAARLGGHATLCGRLGDDAFGEKLRAGLLEAGVDAANVWTTPGTSSGVAWIGVDAAGTNAITVIPGANGSVTPADVDAWTPALRSADVVLVQLEIPLPAAARVIQVARKLGVRTILDVAPIPAEPLPDELWLADIVSPNQAEAEALTGICVESIDAGVAAARVLRQRGAGCVVLKLGGLGALIDQGDSNAEHVPAWAITPVDTTAAGDAFTAALGVAWSAGQTLSDATRFACAAGACACLKLGAQPSLPLRQDVEALAAAGQALPVPSPPF
jgi:ribokinase